MQADISHQTIYRFSGPVRLQPHMLRLRPRSDARQSLMNFDCAIEPAPTGVAWSLDVSGNAVMHAWFEGLTELLRINTHCRVAIIAENPFDFILTGATHIPVSYPGAENPFLMPYLSRLNANAKIDAYVREIAQRSEWDTLAFLSTLNREIAQTHRQIERPHGEPLAPEETLQHREGACRDLAVLFIDCCRSLGIAARFVSGYSLNDPDQAHHRLHAWAEVYLPGGGWRGYDPSVGLAVADRHIALAAAGLPVLAAPVTGSFEGGRVSSSLDARIDISFHSPSSA